MSEEYPVIITGFKEGYVTLKESEHPTGKEKKFYVEGLAIPFNTVSSNGVLYTKESLIESIPQWIDLPVMYNHLIEGNEYPVGKVVNMAVGNINGQEGLIYKAEIDSQETKLLNKVKNGYLNKVSIHILPSQIKKESEYQVATVDRPLELSIVPVPGFRETNMAAYMEKIQTIKNNIGDVNMKTKKENSETPQEEIIEEKQEVHDEEVKEEIENKEELKEKIKQKIQEKLTMLKQERKERSEILSLKEEQSKLKSSLKNLVGIVEELIESDEENATEELVQEHEVNLNDIADILQTITNRLDRIEEMVSKEPEVETEEKEEKEIELIPEETKSDEMMEKTNSTSVKENVVADEKDIAKNNISKAYTKEKIKIVLSDLF